MRIDNLQQLLRGERSARLRAEAVENNSPPCSVVRCQLLHLALCQVVAAADGAAHTAAHRLLLGTCVDNYERTLLVVVVLPQERVAELTGLDPRESARRDFRAASVCELKRAF